MSEYLKILYFLIILGILITLFVAFYRILYPHNNIKIIKEFDNEHIFKTGDLIFSSYNTHLGRFMKTWSGSVWSHVGTILCTNPLGSSNIEDVYVMETADYRHPDPEKNINGIVCLPLHKWLKINKKCIIGYMGLKVPENYDRRIIAQEFLNIKNMDLDKKSISFRKFVKLAFTHNYDPEEFKTTGLENPTCYELVVLIYQNAEICEKIHSPGSYFASYILQGKLKLKPGFEFEKSFIFNNKPGKELVQVTTLQ